MTRRGLIMVFSLAFGVVAASCAALNPNTEGQILSALEAKMSEFKVCYEAALDKDREAKGTIGLELKINEESGEVTSSAIEDSTFIDNQMNQCVSNAASTIALPEPPGVPVEGHYDINFDFN